MNILPNRKLVVTVVIRIVVRIYLKGFVPKLVMTLNNIEVFYEPCDQKILEDERREASMCISSMHMPKDVLQATLDSIIVDSNSREVLKMSATAFVEYYKKTESLPAKGFYIHGRLWCGEILFTRCNCQ